MSSSFAKERMAGVLMHPTSLPSPYGIGDMGKGAYDFIDFLEKAGQSLWQVLPLGPTGYGDSPYQLFSSFAGQPLIISPEKLIEMDLLSEAEVADNPAWGDRVDYGPVVEYKTLLLKRAFGHFMMNEDVKLAEEYQQFIRTNAFWLEDYALYMACKELHGGVAWTDWEEEYKNPTAQEKEEIKRRLDDKTEFYRFVQFIFYIQWSELRAYANKKGIKIIGDIPIFVAFDSADTWASKDLFKLDEKGYPLSVAGVPPDYFSATGQLWGNPVYDWDVMKADSFRWWIQRITHQLKLYDYIRIDHFRGFEAFWAVPYGEETAVNGEWIKAPGDELFEQIRLSLGKDIPIIAEDLGVITPEVEALRDTFGLPGMKVLQFAFDSDARNPFLPHMAVANSICYTGTHDNDTTLGWYNTASDYTKNHCREYLRIGSEGVVKAMIATALAGISKMAVVPMQDYLGLGSEGRMNTPGVAAGNWSWRCKADAFKDELAGEINRLTYLYGRKN